LNPYEIPFDKMVSSEEERRIEDLAIKAGHDPLVFNQKAGEAVALAVDRFIKKHSILPIVHCLIGKGNNGKDGTQAIHFLQELGYEIHQGVGHLDQGGVILDALYGIGFHGEILGDEARLVMTANGSGLPIIAVDIPSGIHGSTGYASVYHIQASHCVAIGTYKLGHVVGAGYKAYKTIELVDFGLGQSYFDQMEEVCRVVRLSALVEPELPKVVHKYDRGYVGIIAGSKGMEGSAYLCAKAALRAGAGMVRLFCDEDFHLPLVEAVFSEQTIDAFRLWAPKLDAIVIGPGLAETKKELIDAIFDYLMDHPKPLIVDAGAIPIYVNRVKKPFAIVTPNGSEMRHLRNSKKEGFVLFEKGAPTWIFEPIQPKPYVILEAEPRLATAGAGDILGGIMAAYLIKTGDYLESAVLAARRLLKAVDSCPSPFPIATDILEKI
jgi:NAD(P)H-hydrate epimerase